MDIERVKDYRYIIKGLSCQTTAGVDFEKGDEFFTKCGKLRKGFVFSNQL